MVVSWVPHRPCSPGHRIPIHAVAEWNAADFVFHQGMVSSFGAHRHNPRRECALGVSGSASGCPTDGGEGHRRS